MIGEARLSGLVGELREVEYRLASKRELSQALEDNAVDHRRRARLPAPSLASARDSADMSNTLSRLNDEEQDRVGNEIRRLQEEKALLLEKLYTEGMPTDRWIGVGDRYVHLCRTSENEADSGVGLRLHEIPTAYQRYIVVGEDPAITERRVSYAESYHRGKKQMTLSILALVPVALVYWSGLTPLWVVCIAFAVVAGICAFVWPEGWKMVPRMVKPGESVNNPWLEVMAHTGDRLVIGKHTDSYVRDVRADEATGRGRNR